MTLIKTGWPVLTMSITTPLASSTCVKLNVELCRRVHCAILNVPGVLGSELNGPNESQIGTPRWRTVFAEFDANRALVGQYPSLR